ncbi:MAG: FAD-dependent thymidylate synthase [Actinobacteria bacterium]|nr:FAD-dependent thymidylate synthase [Actinomycetota bacterium]
MDKIQVLDNGFVELSNISGGDQTVVDAARVSYGGDGKDRPPTKDKKLIRYLWNNRHTSPFEHVTMTFHVKTPIFVARQWMR